LCLCAYVFPAASVRVRWRGPVRIAGWQRTRASMLGRGRLAKSCRRCVKGYFWSSALARALFVCPFCVASGGHGHGNAGGLLRLWRANRRGSRDCSTPSELCTARNAQHCRSETDRTSCRAWSDDIKLDECARAASPRAGIKGQHNRRQVRTSNNHTIHEHILMLLRSTANAGLTHEHRDHDSIPADGYRAARARLEPASVHAQFAPSSLSFW